MASTGLEAGNGLDRDSFDSFVFFAGLQHMRLPSVDRDIQIAYASAIWEVTRVSFRDVDRDKAVMKGCAAETGEAISVSPESMVEAVQGKRFTTEANGQLFPSNMLHPAMTLREVWVSNGHRDTAGCGGHWLHHL